MIFNTFVCYSFNLFQVTPGHHIGKKWLNWSIGATAVAALYYVGYAGNNISAPQPTFLAKSVSDVEVNNDGKLKLFDNLSKFTLSSYIISAPISSCA